MQGDVGLNLLVMAAAIELTACPGRDGDGRPGDWSISKQETGLAGYVTFVLGVATYHAEDRH